MTTPHITEVREHLMATLAALRSKDHPMEPDRARAVAQVASVLVDTARVEVDYCKATGSDHSSFLAQVQEHTPPQIESGPSAHNPFPLSVRHRLGE